MSNSISYLLCCCQIWIFSKCFSISFQLPAMNDCCFDYISYFMNGFFVMSFNELCLSFSTSMWVFSSFSSCSRCSFFLTQCMCFCLRQTFWFAFSGFSGTITLYISFSIKPDPFFTKPFSKVFVYFTHFFSTAILTR